MQRRLRDEGSKDSAVVSKWQTKLATGPHSGGADLQRLRCKSPLVSASYKEDRAHCAAQLCPSSAVAGAVDYQHAGRRGSSCLRTPRPDRRSKLRTLRNSVVAGTGIVPGRLEGVSTYATKSVYVMIAAMATTRALALGRRSSAGLGHPSSMRFAAMRAQFV
eukprot:6184439-Pleurochrysis_carterae.AAC.2